MDMEPFGQAFIGRLLAVLSPFRSLTYRPIRTIKKLLFAPISSDPHTRERETVRIPLSEGQAIRSERNAKLRYPEMRYYHLSGRLKQNSILEHRTRKKAIERGLL